MIKYVNTTRNEMPTHVHQNNGSLWIATEMKLHVNRTCFHATFEISKWYEFISPLIWTYSKRYERFGYSTKPMSFVQTVWIINSYRLLLPKNDFLHSEIKDVLRNFLNIYDGAKMFNIKSYNNRSLIIT